MANSWFRMYADFVNNPKVQILTEALRYRYVALLCLHCNKDYENRPDDEIALSLRVTVEEWIFTRDEFVRRELLTPQFKIKGWEIKQYISDLKDKTSAERQKRYREKKRNNRNATVTSRLPETETETEEVVYDTTVNNLRSKEERKKESNIIYMPFLELPREWMDWAINEKGFNEAHIKDIFSEFKEYWRNGKGKKTKREDWLATWRNWIRNQRVATKTTAFIQKPKESRQGSITL